MKRSIEQLLIAASEGAASNAHTDLVMARIKNEILSDAVRTTSVNKKEIFVMKLRHLPKFAVILLAIVAVLTVSGTAYALYALWQKPVVRTESPVKNQYGRTQIAASFENCSDRSQQSTFEIKKDSQLDQSEVDKVLQARCEWDVINDWANQNELVNMDSAVRTQPVEGTIVQLSSLSSVASKVVSVTDAELSLAGS